MARGTPGTLNYHLGDVSDGVTAGAGVGDAQVGMVDLSALGAAYGLSGAAVAPVAYLDVGPTSDGTVDGERNRAAYAMHLALRNAVGFPHREPTIRQWLQSAGLEPERRIDLGGTGALAAIVAREASQSKTKARTG